MTEDLPRPLASGLCVSLIAAVAQRGELGRNNGLPWRLRDDMRFFTQTTRGRTVVTGRKNFDAMGGPLPGRRNIVVTRQLEAFPQERGGQQAAGSVEQALRLAAAAGETHVFVIGGAQIYAAALPYAHDFYRTRVLAAVEADVFFPPFDEAGWRVEELFRHEADARNEHAFVVERLSRESPPRSFATT